MVKCVRHYPILRLYFWHPYFSQSSGVRQPLPSVLHTCTGVGGRILAMIVPGGLFGRSFFSDILDLLSIAVLTHGVIPTHPPLKGRGKQFLGRGLGHGVGVSEFEQGCAVVEIAGDIFVDY